MKCGKEGWRGFQEGIQDVILPDAGSQSVEVYALEKGRDKTREWWVWGNRRVDGATFRGLVNPSGLL